jgi:t-SNARE complex subunit (syntaxin)
MITKFDEYSELNEGKERRKNKLLSMLDDFMSQKDKLKINLAEDSYNELYQAMEDNNWDGALVLEKNPKNSLEKVLKFIPK